MRRVLTVEEWGRRKELVAELLGAAGAIAAFGLFALGQTVPAIASLGFAAVTGLIRAVLGLRVAAAKKRREEMTLGGQLHVDIEPVGKVDPTKIGVDPAAREETHLNRDLLDYVPRTEGEVDIEVRRALREALDGSGRGIVVVYGLPKVGKSRTLFEALRHLDAGGEDLHLVAPTNGDAVRALLERVGGRFRGRKGRRYVLWLDDIETFVGDQVGLSDLAAWQQEGAIVAATYGGKGAKRDFGDKSDGVAALADAIMLQARQIGLQRMTPEEMADLPECYARVNRKAIKEYGLPAALVAAQQLELKLKSQHGASKSAAAGAAIVYTAINWARCGRTDAISRDLLRELWHTHLEGVQLPNSDKLFKKGLKWALDPVTGPIALLNGVDSFRAYDFIRGAAARDPRTPRISEATWARALDTDDPSQAFGVGMAANAAKRTTEARRVLARAASHGESVIAGAASFNLAVLLEEKGYEEEAEAALQRAIKLGSSEALGYSSREAAERRASEAVSGPPLEMRAAIEKQFRDEGELTGDERIKWKEELVRDEVEEGDGVSAEELGMALLHDGKPREAEEMFRKAIELGRMPATVLLGLALEDLDDLEGAEATFREAAEHGLADGAFNLGVLLNDKGDLAGSEKALRQAAGLGVAAGANNLAVLLERRGDLAGAEDAYRRAMELGFPRAAAVLGGLQARMGRMDEAEASFRQGAERGEMSGAVALARLLIEQGDIEAAREAFRPYAEANGTDESLLVATVLREHGDLEGAEAAYRESMAKGIAVAAFQLGRMLEGEGRIEEADAAYEIAVRLEDAAAEMEGTDPEEEWDEDDEGGEAGLVPTR